MYIVLSMCCPSGATCSYLYKGGGITPGMRGLIYTFKRPSYLDLKEAEVFGGHLLSEDDNSHWAQPCWNIMKETFSWCKTKL